MELREDNRYIPIDIHLLRNVTRDINFDLYLKISEDNFAHVFSRSTGLDYKRLAQYLMKGTQELFIKQEDQTAFQNFILQTTEKILSDPLVTKEKKIASLLNMTEQNMAELFAQFNVSEDTAKNTQRVVKNYVSLLADQPKTLSILLRLVSHGEYLYYHSIAVSIFSMFTAKAMGQYDRRTIEMIGLGGFLHDIGCTQLSDEITNSSRDLTPGEWTEMRSHPRLGLKMIENTPNIPDEVRYIVYQHHEQANGSGYPNGLKGDAIFFPARIVAVADAFSALISNRPFRLPYTVDQALHILESDTGRYEPELVAIVVSIFKRRALPEVA